MEKSLSKRHSHLLKKGHKENKYNLSQIKKLGKRKRTYKTKKLLSEKLKERWNNPKSKIILEQSRKKATDTIRFPLGTKRIRKDGYVEIKVDPVGGWELEHRWIMENHLKRKLTKKEVIHHKNFIKHHNKLDNLQILTDMEHNRLHMKKRIREN